MKKLCVLSAILILGFLLSSCGINFVAGSGKIIDEDRPVQSIEKVSFSGSGEMFLSQGDNETLKIEAEDNVMPYIMSDMHNGILRVYLNHSEMAMIRPTRPIRVYLTVKNISGVELSGTGVFHSDGIDAKDLQIDISGAGKMFVANMKVNSINARISGAGRCELSGNADSQTVEISGSGFCNTSNLISRDVQLIVSGAGKANVRADKFLDVNISGSGDVSYYGHPQLVQKISGSGNIYKQGN